jgi:hypothetical protein
MTSPPGGVDTFLARVLGHRGHETCFVRKVRRVSNSVRNSIGNRWLFRDLSCTRIGT